MNLEGFMKLVFQMQHHYKYSYSDIMNWIPWERNVYIYQLQAWLQEEERLKKK
tara:strand:- start:2146 stop:2304 length:159 start_codon:yes stop_codon:yes gene_type:complete